MRYSKKIEEDDSGFWRVKFASKAHLYISKASCTWLKALGVARIKMTK